MKTHSRISLLGRTLIMLAALLGHASYEVDSFVVSSSRAAHKPIHNNVGASSPATSSRLFPMRREMAANDIHKIMKKNKFGGISSLIQVSVQRLKHMPQRWSRRQSLLVGKVRRSLAVLCMAAFLWFGVAGISTPPSYASSEAAAVPTTAVAPTKVAATGTSTTSGGLFSKSLDEIVDGYVKQHMFADDVYDPVESTYREALADESQGIYPRELSEVASSVFGQGGIKTTEKASSSTAASSSSKTDGLSIGGLLTTGITFLQKRAGMSESTAIFVLAAAFVVAGPVAFLTSGMIIGGASKRQMNKVFKQRYGDTYTVDATIKVEEDVEAPDDDDDEDADDDNDDDDDEGDDE